MKKVIITVLCAALVMNILAAVIIKWGPYAHSAFSEDVPVKVRTKGREIEIRNGEGDAFKPFSIKGVNIFEGYPGKKSSDHPIDTKTWLVWFEQIKNLGANTIRIYTIASDTFYKVLLTYNTDHSNDPLYVLQGVTVSDYSNNSHIDAYDSKFLGTMIDDEKRTVDVVHGRAGVQLGYGTTSTSGFYHYDISQWVLGYIVGTDWNSMTVSYTDMQEENKRNYQGKYLRTSDDASPFEAMLARAGDALIGYEEDRFGEQRLISFTNSPYTDPFNYSEALEKMFLKYACVDVSHILPGKELRSGQFASFKCYSYDPDFLRYDSEWQKSHGGEDTYSAYLKKLAQYFTMPTVITEFGFPTSRIGGFNGAKELGYRTEENQGESIVEDAEKIREAGCAGQIVFSWQDEWWRRSWNTLPDVDPDTLEEWDDVMDNDAGYGLIAFDSGKEKTTVVTDGDASEWKADDLVVKSDSGTLSVRQDFKYLYLYLKRAKGSSHKLYIPIDVTARSGSETVDGLSGSFSRPADFLLETDGGDQARLLVQSYYEEFRAAWQEYFGEKNPYIDPPLPDSSSFLPIYFPIRQKNINSVNEAEHKPLKVNSGKLIYALSS